MRDSGKTSVEVGQTVLQEAETTAPQRLQRSKRECPAQTQFTTLHTVSLA